MTMKKKHHRRHHSCRCLSSKKGTPVLTILRCALKGKKVRLARPRKRK